MQLQICIQTYGKSHVSTLILTWEVVNIPPGIHQHYITDGSQNQTKVFVYFSYEIYSEVRYLQYMQK